MTQQERYRHIRSLMVAKGVTNVDIAKEAEVSRQRVYNVMIGRSTGERIRGIIAETTGVKTTDIWPEQRRAA